MSFFTTGEGYSLRHLTDSYPWSSFTSGTVVDLGGSHGDAAFALARKYPELHLIVQDLPAVVANSTEEKGLNVGFMAHDFFEEQPVKDADVYYYRWCFHDWSDKYCIKALKALIPALKKGARVLIVDAVMPPPGALPNDLDRKLRLVYSYHSLLNHHAYFTQGDGSDNGGVRKQERTRSRRVESLACSD
jgi:SAM-dependent methyltransferase